MGLENLIFALIGAAIFGLGVAVGGIIEYSRSIKKIEERDEFYLQTIDEIAHTLYRVEDKIRIIHKRISYTTDELRKLKERLDRYDPEETQLLNVWSPREQHHTPSLPYQLSDDDYDDYGA